MSALGGARTVADAAHPAARTRSYGEALRDLQAAQKSSKGAPAYSRFVNRPLGRRFAAAAYRLRATPNVVTAVSAFFTYAAILTLALGRVSGVLGLLVALALVIGYALDAADGQLARLLGGGSAAGEWLDHMVDSGKIASMHLAVLLCLHRTANVGDAWLLVPMGFAVVAVVAFFAQLLNEALSARSGVVRTPTMTSSPLWSLFKLPTDYGVLCLAFAAMALGTGAFLALYSLLFVGSLTYLLLALPKWFQDMCTLDNGGTA